MKFHVAGLLKEPTGATRAYEVAENVAEIDGEVRTVGNVTGDVKLMRTNTGIVATAKLRVDVLLTCGRCLTAFAVPLKIAFSEQFMPVIDVGTGLPLPKTPDSATFPIDENHVLDLSEAFRQYALLALPMAPTCKADCKGLCASCGKDLNQGLCDCPRQVTDERWAALADIVSETGLRSDPEGHGRRLQGKTRRRS